jgi:hypothetical protein
MRINKNVGADEGESAGNYERRTRLRESSTRGMMAMAGPRTRRDDQRELTAT